MKSRGWLINYQILCNDGCMKSFNSWEVTFIQCPYLTKQGASSCYFVIENCSTSMERVFWHYDSDSLKLRSVHRHGIPGITPVYNPYYAPRRLDLPSHSVMLNRKFAIRTISKALLILSFLIDYGIFATKWVCTALLLPLPSKGTIPLGEGVHCVGR